MTADERIEKLLNRFGQTISDLPITYHPSHRYSARSAAYNWAEKNKPELLEAPFATLPTYICHLCDVIDRMEIALETAVRCTDCGTCEFEHTGECSGIIECNYRICDGCLMDSDGMEGC